MNQNELAAKQKKRRQVITVIVLIMVFILFVIPFLLVLINVFKTKGDITSNPLALIGEHGFTLQNFPEGAVISMPLASEGEKKGKAFLLGTLSGAVEPVMALITIFLTGFITDLLPYLLSFAAGAMLYVVVEELIPEAAGGDNHTNHGTIGFGVGFILMMILDVALG